MGWGTGGGSGLCGATRDPPGVMLAGSRAPLDTASLPLPCPRQVSKKLTVIVEDRNDNAPVFKGLPYETSIPEVPPGHLAAPRAVAQG